jgi:hypothetical protein
LIQCWLQCCLPRKPSTPSSCLTLWLGWWQPQATCELLLWPCCCCCCCCRRVCLLHVSLCCCKHC